MPIETITGRMPERLDERFRQSEWWKPKDTGWIRIADMEPSHRANTARYLLRRAAAYADAIGFAELSWFQSAPEELVDSWLAEDGRRMDDPAGWIRSTPLYRALVAGLAVDAGTDDVMAALSPRSFTVREMGEIQAAYDERLADADPVAPEPACESDDEYDPPYDDLSDSYGADGSENE
jgi:hypothetical protein